MKESGKLMQQSRWILQGVALSIGYEAIREQRHENYHEKLAPCEAALEECLSGQIMASDTISMAEAQKVGAEILFEVLDNETDDTSTLGNNRLQSGKLTLTEIYRGLVDGHTDSCSSLRHYIPFRDRCGWQRFSDLDELREYVANIKPRKTEEWTLQAKRFLFSLTFWLAFSRCVLEFYFYCRNFYYHGPMEVYRNLNLRVRAYFFSERTHLFISVAVGTHFDILEGAKYKMKTGVLTVATAWKKRMLSNRL